MMMKITATIRVMTPNTRQMSIARSSVLSAAEVAWGSIIVSVK